MRAIHGEDDKSVRKSSSNAGELTKRIKERRGGGG